MIDAYLDESGIHDGADICVIAGYFGTSFKKLEHDWLRVLKKFNVPLEKFHAKEFVKNPKHNQLIKELCQAIGKCKSAHPVTFGIVVKDFENYTLPYKRFLTGAAINNGKFVTSGCPRKSYFVPFQLMIRRITMNTPPGGKARCFFGLDRTFAGYAIDLFKRVKQQDDRSDWKTRDRLGEPSFPLAKETPQLQAADLLVYLSYRHMLERLAENNWKVLPEGNLRRCLKNLRSVDDCAFQDKETLQSTIDKFEKKFQIDVSKLI